MSPFISRSDAAIRLLLGQVAKEPSEKLENEQLEFKEYQSENSLFQSKDIADEICAFANASGGMILIGVRDSSNIKGAKWNEQLVGFGKIDLVAAQERLQGKLMGCRPLRLREVDYLGQSYLVIDVESRPDSLVSTRNGKYYVREGRSSRPMTPDEVTYAVKHLTNYDWSAEHVLLEPAAALDDADLAAAIADFASKRKLSRKPVASSYLEAIGATHNGRLLRGGLLWLGTASAIKSALGRHEFRFTWKKPNGELLINEIWEGNLWSAVAAAKALFAKSNAVRNFSIGKNKVSAPLLDPIAFHEAYLNALAHRDYAEDGMISVAYSDSIMKVTSPGLFYGGVTAENIGKHEPRHRNKALAKILMEHGLVDRAGQGVLRMSLGSLRYGRSVPVFSERYGCVEVAMQAEFLRPGITVISLQDPQLGVPELIILNSVYEVGYVAIGDLERKIGGTSAWRAIKAAVRNLGQVELCGTRDGIYVRVNPAWNSVLNVKATLRITSASKKHVELYDLLKTQGSAANADITSLLEHRSSSQTSQFLSNARYVRRTGSGPSARWELK